MISTRRWKRTTILALLALGVVVLAAVGVWMSPGGSKGRELAVGLGPVESGAQGEIGTTGTTEPQVEGTSKYEPNVTGLIHDVETITGTTDGHELVGRAVELHVPIQQHINDVAFWVGFPDNRLLVVISRDTRDGRTRQLGEISPNAIVVPQEPGQVAVISGHIQPIPYAEAMFSWGLTNPDRAQLRERPIYLKADRVSPVQEARAIP
jgi:hypothetical protein